MSYNAKANFELNLGLQKDALSFKMIPWLRTFNNDDAGNIKIKNSWDLKEGWGEYSEESWSLRLGNQLFSWGASDRINPTDVLNPRDYSDPLSSEKLPIMALRLRLHSVKIEPVELEFILTPFFKESVLPWSWPASTPSSLNLYSSRWLWPLPRTFSDQSFTVPLNYFLDKESFAQTLQFGAKARASGIEGWDYSLYFFDGVESLPRIAFSKEGVASDPNLPIEVTLHPSYHRQRMFGADASGSFSFGDQEFGLRLELAHFWRFNDRAYSATPELRQDLEKDNYVHIVGGVDHTLQENFLGGIWYLNLQYVFFQNLGRLEQSVGSLVLTGLPNAQPWDRNLIFYLEERITSNFKVTNTVVWSFTNEDGFIRPASEYQFNDSLKFRGGGEFFLGKAQGFYGQFKANHRIHLAADYVF